jgi:hypothetical protein
MVDEDIEVTKLVAPIAVDIKSGRNLITRRLSRGVVADCFDKSAHMRLLEILELVNHDLLFMRCNKHFYLKMRV